MKRFVPMVILFSLFWLSGCDESERKTVETPQLEAPIPPGLSPESFALEALDIPDAVEKLGKVAPLATEDKRRQLLIPEPSEAVELLGEYRQKVPTGNRGGIELAHIPPSSEGSVGTLSLGNTSSGKLVDGRKIPIQGKFHRVLNRTIERNTLYGTDELIDSLLSVAEEVGKAFPGAPLVIGNLSQPKGGDIPQSVSHNSGRDADIAFYVLSSDGKSVPPDWYVSIDPDGKGTDGSGNRFDAARNWTLVESLLKNRKIQVQYLFVADWIKTLLIDYAIRAGADPELIRRGEHVLTQPGDSSPHAEHFHLRLYCDLNDRLYGCHDGGKRHPWIEDWSEAVEERISRLIDAYQSGVQSERDAALRELDLLRMVPEEEAQRAESL